MIDLEGVPYAFVLLFAACLEAVVFASASLLPGVSYVVSNGSRDISAEQPLNGTLSLFDVADT